MTVVQFLFAASAITMVFSFWMAARYYSVKFDASTISVMGLMVALGTAAGPLMVPVGPANAFPIQHTINVLAGVILGPVEAVIIALLVGVLRNILGLGTVLALPGGMIGAFLAGVAYRHFRREEAAAAAEIFGTGLLGALASVPIVGLVLGQEMAAFGLVIPFGISATVGALIAGLILKGGGRWIRLRR